jgi:predicted nucleic acid-binding protein
MVLETAANGEAEAIVRFNRRHFVSMTKQFGIEVLSPAEIVTQLEKKL